MTSSSQSNNYGANPNEPESKGKLDLEDLKFLIWRRYQNFMDRTTIFPRERWGSLVAALAIFFLRVFFC
jgi:hypothetical protein